MNCKDFCLLCNRPKVFTINYSKFHGVCENERDLNKILICIHCKSVTPVLDFSLAYPDRDIQKMPEKVFEPFTTFGIFNKPSFPVTNAYPKELIKRSPYTLENLKPQPHPIRNNLLPQQMERGTSISASPVGAFVSNLEDIHLKDEDPKSLPLLSNPKKSKKKQDNIATIAIFVFFLIFILCAIFI